MLFLQALERFGLDPLPEAETYEGTIQQLLHRLKMMETYFWDLCSMSDSEDSDAKYYGYRHVESTIRGIPQQAFKQLKFHLSPAQKLHLERQRHKSRIDTDWENSGPWSAWP